METVLASLLDLVGRLFWPFCRIGAALGAAPVFGDGVVPMRARMGAALLLTWLALPGATPPDVPLVSLAGAVRTVDQLLIGLLFGMALQFVSAAFSLAGFVIASKCGFTVGQINDPLNGVESNVLSNFLTLLCGLMFLATNSHLVLIDVVYASFRVWPLNAGVDAFALRNLAYQLSWVFASAMLLALPAVTVTLAIQIGLGLLSRATPTINVFSLGFAVTIAAGLLTFAMSVDAFPTAYVSLSTRAHDLLSAWLGVADGN
ncbi:flagellar biosynthetic protein FliR [Chitinasiproducens palmae]|uniref:Flagellar biosynthetic protein FliR n=1 Tax=Chitinasiproducens palmae TaxID=1770053 RepID=A0A1H2PKE7_9BURK|nr:flagellar biosynthetic protein FliR [Chitinasiproducens palmae]SDV46924.1 flagellar biosynthetic protein FliR [Chitinasiproducens palmae]